MWGGGMSSEKGESVSRARTNEELHILNDYTIQSRLAISNPIWNARARRSSPKKPVEENVSDRMTLRRRIGYDAIQSVPVKYLDYLL